MKYGTRVRLNEQAHSDHTGRKPLYRGEGTIVKPFFRIQERAIPTRLVEWDNGKTTLTSEDHLEEI